MFLHTVVYEHINKNTVVAHRKKVLKNIAGYAAKLVCKVWNRLTRQEKLESI